MGCAVAAEACRERTGVMGVLHERVQEYACPVSVNIIPVPVIAPVTCEQEHDPGILRQRAIPKTYNFIIRQGCLQVPFPVHASGKVAHRAGLLVEAWTRSEGTRLN